MSDQAFLAVALTMASACVNALIQLQGRPPDVHGFGEDYQRVLSIRQIARANYYYLLWDNLNTDPTDVGSESWWKFQKEHRLAILVAVHDEFDDDTAARPDKETEGDKQTVTAADVASVESVIEPGAA